MRVAIVVLVAFVALYVLVTSVGVTKHGKEARPSSSTQRLSLPGILSDAWPLAPPFLKVGAADVTIGQASLTVPPSTQFPIFVRAATQWYQPKRLMRLTYLNAYTGGSVALVYPPIAAPETSGSSPAPLSAAQPSQVIVLPKSGGVVQLTCTSSIVPCAVSL